MDMEDSKTITLGTIPLVGFQPPPPDGQTNNMLPSVPTPSTAISLETPLLYSQNRPNEANPAPYPMYPQGNVFPNSPQTTPYPPQPYPNTYPGMNPSVNVNPSAPMMENQSPVSMYPGSMFNNNFLKQFNVMFNIENIYFFSATSIQRMSIHGSEYTRFHR